MKNILMVAAVLGMVSCNSGETGTDQAQEAKAPETQVTGTEGIGFNTMLPDLKFKLGTEDAIQVVRDLDEKWAARDYEGMRQFFSDTAVAYFPDGRIAESGDVQAGFTGTSTVDGTTEKKYYHEWYYVVDGRIAMFRQYTIDVLPEEES